MSTKEKREKSSKQKKQDGIALAIWFLAMLIIVVLFIIYWPEISKNINAQIEKRNKTEQNSSQETSQPQIPQEEQEQITIDLNDGSSEDTPVEQFSPKESKPQTEQIPSQTKEPQNIQEVQKEEPVSKPIEAKRKLTLYFVAIDSDGSIVRKPVVKTVPKTEGPRRYRKYPCAHHRAVPTVFPVPHNARFHKTGMDFRQWKYMMRCQSRLFLSDRHIL